MALSNEDKIEMRIALLNELKVIFGDPQSNPNETIFNGYTVDKVRKTIQARLRKAHADKIALINPDAAELYRKQI